MIKIAPVQHAGLAAIELVDHGTRLVVVHEIGPRIAACGVRDRPSFFYWDDAGAHTRGDWRMYGGHRLWTTRPDADESEETYSADNLPCEVHELPDGVRVTAPPNSSRLEKSLVIRATAGAWTIEHRLRNVSDMMWSGGVWGLSCTLPTERTRYRVPLDGGIPAWDVLTMVIPRRWGGSHTSRLADPQFELTEDALAFAARGTEAKRMLFAPRGALEMIDPARGRFTKSAPAIAGARYPLNTNVAMYLGPRSFMVELETMSATSALGPDETLVHTETWTVEPLG